MRFQSTPLHQWWLILFSWWRKILYISIHTTASVVTLMRLQTVLLPVRFQSTPLHQWWPKRGGHTLGGTNFNPHHCISGDVAAHQLPYAQEISIHTTASVVTRDRAIQRRNQKISIHTTASVVTRILLVIIRVPEISIHTTASVVTQLLLFSYRLLWFQSTPLHQWWPAEITEENFVLAFQSTPLHQWWQRRARRGKKLINFNPHHCISGDKTYNAGPAPPNYFNPHHCISGDKRLWDHNDEQDEFQSTPLHQWWRGFLDKNAGKFDISIHTTASVVTLRVVN